jgi:phage terminase Nu1 subunit (DNA packaging protein)
MARRPAKTADEHDAWLHSIDTPDDKRAAAIAEIDADLDDSIPGECFDKAGLARAFRMTPYAVDAAIKRGAPVQRRGDQFTPWEINAGDFLRWQIKDACGLLDDADATQASVYLAEKCRKTAADAERLEMDNEKKRSQTLTVDEAVTLYREAMAPVRAELNAIPGRAVEALGKLDADERRNASIVENVLDNCVNNALKAISLSGVENASA